MERREFLIGTGATVVLAGCIGNNENSGGSNATDTNTEEEQPTETTESDTKTETETETESETETTEETEEPDPAEFKLTDLSVDSSEVAPGETVTVTATVQNIGGKVGTEQLQFDIEGPTVEVEVVGDTTYEEITEEGETVSKEVTISPGESETVSFSVARRISGSFGVYVADRSVSFQVAPEWDELGEAYEGAGGLTVVLESLDVNKKTGSYEYTIEYTLENETDGAIDEGGFQLYPTDTDNDPLQQYGSFGELFPGDTVLKSYTFEEEKSIEFSTLAYHPDQFFRKVPPTDALVWPVEY